MFRPYIVGLGGTTREGSSTEKALSLSLRAAASQGADTLLLCGSDIDLPAYVPAATSNTKANRVTAELGRADGIILGTPGYHGGLSGLVKNALDYRATATKNGHMPDSESIIISAMAFVAKTEEKAIEEGKEHILFYFKNLLKTDSHLNSPPGYLPVERLRKRLESGAIQETEVTWEGLTSVYRTVLGTPDQVAERIAFWCEQAQSSKIILHLHVGDMPHWKAVKNITLFAEEVIPRVRKLTSSALQVAAE